ncbi:MAG: hypothetical protein IJB52_17080 [Clostridia bacterium]|nr:hypothetical protein [Clostridia bacterium]
MDGTKIEANANRYTFVWAKAVQNSWKNWKYAYNVQIGVENEYITVPESYGRYNTSILSGQSPEEIRAQDRKYHRRCRICR